MSNLNNEDNQQQKLSTISNEYKFNKDSLKDVTTTTSTNANNLEKNNKK